MFNEYPYVNLQDVNLDWILKHIKDLEINLQDFVKLNTIKYADPIIWNITKQYETNTVVIDGNTGTAYISVQPVPAGVALTNTDYWTVIFTLNLTTSNQNITFRDDGTNVVATFASDTGDWILWNFYLYRVMQPIAVNTAYVEGFNIERFSVELFIRDYINTLATKIGDLDDLTTSDKDSIVDAINSLVIVIGALDDLTTSDNTNIVNAINSLVTVIGDLNDLNTVDKTNIVNAINSTLIGYYTPEMFGAVGDGVADDTAAVQAAMNAGGVILSRHYKLTETVTAHHNVLGLNATLDINTDGENETSALIITGDNIIVNNINFKGNFTGAGTLDGQLEYSHAIRVGEMHNFVISNCNMENFRGDGIYIWDSYDGKIENVNIKGSYRNSVSLIDCYNLTFNNCNFDKTGPYVACVDIEPNQGYNCLIHDIVFDNCQFISADAVALNIYPDTSVPDPSIYDITLRNCILTNEALTTSTVVCNGSGRVYNLNFFDCKISSKVGTPIRINVGDQGNVVLERCTITGTNSGLSAYGIFGARKIIIKDCKYTGVGSISLNTPTGILEMIDNDIEINNYTGNDGYSYNGAINSNCKEYRLKDNYIYGHKGSMKIAADNTTVMIVINNVFKSRVDLTNRIGFEVTSDVDKTLEALIFENNATINNNIPFAFPTAHTLQPGTYSFNQALKKIMYTDGIPSSTAPFSSMTFNVGDIAYHKTPTSGGNIGWVCTVQGTPGTWKAFGSISS